MVYGVRAIGFIKSGLILEMHQSPLWYFLTDLFHIFFGVSLLTSRILSVILGSLAVILVYMIAKELFNERIALLSSFLVMISPYLIRTTIAEMDIPMIFFIMLSFYLFLLFFKTENKKYIYVSAIIFGLASLIKTISLSFLPAFALIFLWKKYNKKEKLFTQDNIILGLKFFLIILVIYSPLLFSNYLLYQDKHITDTYFFRFFDIAPATYEGISSTLKPFSLHDVFFSYENHKPGFYEGLKFVYEWDILIFILFILGLIISFIKNRNITIILLLLILPTFIFLSGTSLLPNHFSFLIPFLAVFSAIFIDFASRKIPKINPLIFLLMALVLISVFSLYTLRKDGALNSTHELQKIREDIKNADDNSLVIIDSRFYRGRVAWMANDKHYVEGLLVSDLAQKAEEINKNKASIKTYFVECIRDDCGWGYTQKEVNDSMEGLVNIFSQSKNVKTIYDNRNNKPYANIYESTLELSPVILQLADLNENFFYYSVGYKNKEQILTSYSVYNFSGKMLNLLSYLIFYLSIILSILSIPLFLYLFFRE